MASLVLHRLLGRSVAGSCNIAIEDDFGPIVEGCLDNFDFTLLFQEAILSITLMGVTILLLLHRLLHLYKQPQKVYSGGLLQKAKLVAFAVFTTVQVALVAIAALPGTPTTAASLACAVVNLLGAAIMWVSSHLEHVRSVRPSLLLNAYFFFSLLFDIVRARTLWAISQNAAFASGFCASVGLKVVCLVLEAVEKQSILLPEYATYPSEATAGFFNRNFFLWLCPTLIRGFSKELVVTELEANDRSLDPNTHQNKLQALWNKWRRWNKKMSHSLLVTYAVHFRWKLAAAVIPRLCLIGFKFAQPFLVQSAVVYLSELNGQHSRNSGYGLIAAYVILYVGIAISGTKAQHKAFRLITMIRGTLISQIFDHTLKLSTSSLNESKAVTLMSSDIERIGTGLRNVHEIWACIIEIALAMWLLQGQLGISIIATGLVTLFCTGGAVWVAKGAGDRQSVWLEAIQRRVHATANMLGSMRGVKMSGLTNDLSANIRKLRLEEISSSYEFRRLLVRVVNLSFMSTALTPVITFLVFSVLAKVNNSQTLTPEILFPALTLFELLASPVSVLIETLGGVMSAVGSFQRIGEYLATEVHVDSRNNVTYEKHGSFGLEMPPIIPRSIISMGRRGLENCIEVAKLSVGYGNNEAPVLKELNFEIKTSQIAMIIGQVGCGKSTLIHALLGEIPKTSGSIHIAFQEAAYCSQTAWITNGTVRQNILGELEMDEAWYNTVIHVCALDTDLQQFNGSDLSMVGSKGVRLSGGQQMRLALARALYSRKAVIFLDDIFSGLDSTTEEKIFARLFGHDGLFRKQKTTVIMATNAVHRLSAADHIIALSSDGRVLEQGSFEELQATGAYTRALAPSKRKTASAEGPMTTQINTQLSHAIAPEVPKGLQRRTGDGTVYNYYIATFGWYKWSILMFFAACYGLLTVFPQVWVNWWATANLKQPSSQLAYYVGIYAALSILSVVALFASCWHLIINLVPKTALKVHDTLLRTVLNAPMSFFAKTDTGVTLNRFSQDLELIDMELPLSVINTVIIFAVIIAQSVLICVTGRYVAAVLPLCVGIVYAVQKYYLRTSRQLRLLDIEAKSPLFSHFLEALAGLATIRAFGWQNGYLEESKRILELSQRPYYMLFCVQRWLGLVLDLIVTGIAVVLVSIGVEAKGVVDTGLMGLALVNIVSFSTNLKFLVTNWTLLETSIGAVSRVRSFEQGSESENNDDGRQRQPPSEWPSAGAITFEGVTARFDESLEKNVLRDVSLTIKGGQRIGICGRSGSGKSSLVSTLFRLLDPHAGRITIDSIDISTLARHEVRSRLTAIPQEPYLLTGTIRVNVDPFGRASDEKIIRVLETVGLWKLVQEKGGLDAMMTEGLFSHGQRQLVCLARAMTRESCVLVMDEASSSLDVKTDALFQQVIRSEFAKHTIIAVAHRLDTVVDFDYVAVLDDGVVVEFDAPEELLKRPSAFRELYESQRGETIEEEDEEISDSTTANEKWGWMWE
ncbi:ABC transporter, transmembrane domain, type 1 [Metarhizium guizhouense ARSEF 977]|uniref:ABC transporter, transmembrane domain, type 1 n=1 Tax=Metarhizium guizhouense (strain ARSEF 977) TaxID=1276136 RepID=A0A0B4HGE5_METGA|nr:ABC transporter, transmembrane domain, type 1 [Metarhizium guizhouense ARSEF 977]